MSSVRPEDNFRIMGSRIVMDSIFSLLLLFLLHVAVARYPRNAEGRVRDFLLGHSNYSLRDRPVLNSNDTVDVTMEMFLYAMLDLNERDEVLTTASWMSLSWRDERLTWDPADFEGETLLVMFPDEIWIPKIFLSNSLNKDALGTTSTERGSIILSADGYVLLGMPMVQSTQCPMDILYFPFDTQRCPFSFIPENQIVEFMVLRAQQSGDPARLDSLEWDLLNITISNYFYPVPNHSRAGNLTLYSGADFCVFLQRDANYYILTLILPSTLMCIMAFVTFLAPPDSGERISLGVSMVLGLTVFQLLIADMLPTSSKRTPVISTYLTLNFVLSCLAVPFSLININIAYGDKKLQILKYTWIRKLFLEYFPCCLSIPTYRDRVKCEIFQVNANPEAGKEGNTSPDLTMISKNAVEPIGQPIEKDRLSVSEKIKLEARTVALVMDRLILVAFLVAFACLFIRVLIAFRGMPEVSFDCHGTI